MFTATLLAERRRARGVKLNYPESVALISAEIMEGANTGDRPVQVGSHYHFAETHPAFDMLGWCEEKNEGQALDLTAVIKQAKRCCAANDCQIKAG